MSWLGKGMSLVAVLIVPSTLLWGQEGEAAAPIVMPDVRANVMRMLEESRQQQSDSAAAEPAPSSPPPATELAEPSPPVQTPPPVVAPLPGDGGQRAPQPQLSAEPQGTQAVTVPTPGRAPRRDGHVPLEKKEITIQNMDDVRKLSEELKAAKKRQAEQNRAP